MQLWTIVVMRISTDGLIRFDPSTSSEFIEFCFDCIYLIKFLNYKGYPYSILKNQYGTNLKVSTNL